ncbi:MAG: hypothetical protein EAZ08_11390 [Cytophagales bacterium]|nr:MAG: hypothetical protein EAZ08_11390 [Cytophagales bacterium]
MKTIKITVTIFILGILSLPLLAQEQKKHEKTRFIDEQGRYYQHVSLPVYLFLSASPDGDEKLRLEKTTANPHAGGFMLDGHGTHYIRHVMTQGKQGEIRFPVYADGIAPISSVKFQTALAYFNAKKQMQFFGTGLTAALSSTDEMSGVSKTYFSIDNADYQDYTSIINFEQEKTYTYKFYAADKVGNVEVPRIRTFTVDITPPTSTPTLQFDLLEDIVSPRTKIALSAEDGGAGVKKIEYRIDEDPNFKTYTGAFDLSDLSDNDHVVRYRAIDHVGNVEPEKTLPIYLDKDAPIVSSEILGDRFVVGGRTYFSGRTKLKLQALDNKSGVQDIFYSIDGVKPQRYEDAFYLPTRAGNHFVNYYAIDKVGNRGSGRYERDVKAMYMDLTGPKLGFSFAGNVFRMRDTVYVNDRTQISLLATDAESGVQQITYNLKGRDDGNETDYVGSPFSIGEEGVHKVMFFGYDNVNNRNRQEFFFKVDKIGPQIFAHFSAKPTEKRFLSATSPSPNPSVSSNGEISVYPKHISVFLAATDEQVGYDRIYYKLNNNPEQLYTAPISGFPAGKLHILKIRAVDKLGNTTIEEMQFQTEN